MNIQRLTAIDILIDATLDGASVHRRHRLRLERPSVLAGVEHATTVYGALERVAFPSEDIIGVGAVPLLVTKTQDERLRAVFGPHAAKLSRISQGLIGHLWPADGM